MLYQETTLMPGNNEGDTEFTPAGANGALGQSVDAISEERSSFGDYRGLRFGRHAFMASHAKI